MKKLLMVLAVLTLCFGTCNVAYAAGEVGEGTCTIDEDEIRSGEYRASIVLLFTGATTNIVGGYVRILVPNIFSGATLTNVASDAGEGMVAVTVTGKNISVNALFPEIASDNTYIHLTVSVTNIGETIAFDFLYITRTAVSVSVNLTFTVREAADVTYTAGAADDITTSPNLYTHNVDNTFSVSYEPTPSILYSLTDQFKIDFTFTMSGEGGQLIIARPQGTPGYQSTPSFEVFSEGTSTPGYIRAVSTTGVIGTPIITDNQAIFPILTAGIGAVVQVQYGSDDVAAQGTSFCRNCVMQWKSNLINPATTVTPDITQVYWNVVYPTPTCAITVTQNDEGKYFVTVNKIGRSGNKFWIGSNTNTLASRSSGGSAGNISFDINSQTGAYSFWCIQQYRDTDNDGSYPRVTSSTVAKYHYADVLENWDALRSSGDVSSEVYVGQDYTVGVAMGITKYTSVTMIDNIKWTGTGAVYGTVNRWVDTEITSPNVSAFVHDTNDYAEYNVPIILLIDQYLMFKPLAGSNVVPESWEYETYTLPVR